MKGLWRFDCTYDEKSRHIRYVGLKNQGCTCYMNSTLQQLFMIQDLRRVLLDAPVKYMTKIPGSQLSPEDLRGRSVELELVDGTWRRANVLLWHPERRTHSVQSENGVVEWFNALEGRQAVGGPETGRLNMLLPIPAPSPPLVGDTAPKKALRVLEQIQRTFLHLSLSEKRFFDPRPLVEASRCMELEFDVMHQNDAPEFCDKLLSKLEDALKGTQSFDAFRLCFGGRFVNQTIPKESTDRFKPRTKPDSFTQVTLKVRGFESIEESLADMVKDELMDGDNKIEFEDGEEKVKLTAIRRTCIARLPNVLVLHLKRFDLDFTTFETVKLNGRVAFPFRLNMLPFTREGIEAAELRRQRTEAEAQGGDVADLAAIPVLDDEDFMYELKGVLVHSGGAQSGHYYSFIRERDGSGWFRFDDDDVTSWDPGNLERDCFGGFLPKSQHERSGRRHEMISNALMVFYDKVRPSAELVLDEDEQQELAKEAARAQERLDEDMRERTDAPLAAETEGHSPGRDLPAAPATELATAAFAPPYQQPEAPPEAVTFSGHQAYEGEIFIGNTAFMRQLYLLDQRFNDFLRSVVRGTVGIREPEQRIGAAAAAATMDSGVQFLSVARVAAVSQDNYRAVVLRVCQTALHYLLDVSWHSRIHLWHSKAWLSVFQATFAAQPHVAGWFLRRACNPSAALGSSEAVDTSCWFHEYLCTCHDYSARTDFVQLLASAASALAPLEEAQLRSEYSAAVRASADHIDDLQPSPKTSRGELETSSAVVELVHRLTTFIQQAILNPNYFARWADEAFALVQALADGHPTLREYLVAKNMVSRLVYAVLGAKASPAVRTFCVSNGSGMNPDMASKAEDAYGTSALSLGMDQAAPLEAIASLVDVPSVSKVPLVVASTVDSEKLSPEAEAAFSLIFDEYSTSDAGMEIMDLNRFLELANIPATSANRKLQITRILASYDTNEQKLTRRGFLNYVTDLSVKSPKMMWASLASLGFRNDLRRMEDVSLPGLPNALSPSPRVPIPDLCMSALSSFPFYEAAHEHIETCVPGIIHRVCKGNLGASMTLLTQTLEELEALVDPSWHDDAVAKAAACVLGGLLTITDAHQLHRLDHAFFSMPLSLMNQAQESARQAIFSQRKRLHRIVAIVEELLCYRPIKEYLHREDNLNRWQWLTKANHEMSGANQVPMDATPDSVQVSHAGSPEVNGTYDRCTDHDGAPAWQRVEGGRRYMIYRCRLENSQHFWYVSHVPSGSPGTRDDEDFYCAPSIYARQPEPVPYEPHPPSSHLWRTREKGVEPFPDFEALFAGDLSTDDLEEPGNMSDEETRAVMGSSNEGLLEYLGDGDLQRMSSSSMDGTFSENDR